MAEPGSACCGPSAQATAGASAIPAPLVRSPRLPAADRAGSVAANGAGKLGGHDTQQCLIPAATFTMGDASGDGLVADGELPLHEVTLDAFEVDATTVTNELFNRFVAGTGYVTEAEQLGVSAVFHLLVDAPQADVTGAIPGVPWWIGVRGANWRHPGGRHSSIADAMDHPVVQVTWNDALAYCNWAGRRLPTEAEWERASRGGRDGARFPWGDEPIDGSDGVWRANVWQGVFPGANSLADGWLGTAPARSYAPNDFGLWQTVGNVWEWCADRFAPDTYAKRPRQGLKDPTGPPAGEERVLRGGSYLCHPSYCNRYRNSARSRNTPDSAMGNAGFRTVSV